jgi:hypothetical protein
MTNQLAVTKCVELVETIKNKLNLGYFSHIKVLESNKMKTIFEQLLSAAPIQVFKRDANNIATHAMSFEVSKISARKFCVTKEILCDGKLYKRPFISGSGARCLRVIKLRANEEIENHKKEWFN